MTAIDYDAAADILAEEFAVVENNLLGGLSEALDSNIGSASKRVFDSNTQAYREVLLGCVLARIQSESIDLRSPYVNQGQTAYNGRTLDEKVVNPFLQRNRIPSTKGPFLSVFRRSVQLEPSTREGLRDKEGFDALLTLVEYLEETANLEQVRSFLRHLLERFLDVRSQSEIPISRLQRVSLSQYDQLLSSFLSVTSGGRIPVLLVEATFRAIATAFDLAWEVEVQGINVADQAAGAGGDITIKQRGSILLAVEVTERSVDRNRMITTFETKISSNGIEDYLFLVTTDADDYAIRQAHRYFSQGHEVNLLDVKDWMLVVLATIGVTGRREFNRSLWERLEMDDVPASLKVAWNEEILRLTTA